MNINTNNLVVDDPFEDFDGGDGETLREAIREHHEIMGRDGRWTMTGRVALIPPSDPDHVAIGVLNVWSEIAEGGWVHVNADGEVVEAACPFGD